MGYKLMSSCCHNAVTSVTALSDTHEAFRFQDERLEASCGAVSLCERYGWPRQVQPAKGCPMGVLTVNTWGANPDKQAASISGQLDGLAAIDINAVTLADGRPCWMGDLHTGKHTACADTSVEEDGRGRDWRHQTYIGTFLRHAVLYACGFGEQALAGAAQCGMFQKCSFKCRNRAPSTSPKP